MLEGRASYQIVLHTGVPDADPYLRHLVVSTTLTETNSAAAELVRGNPLQRVRALKAEDGLDPWLVGAAPSRTPCCPSSTAWC
ncbi:hypothetical protein [Nakamurella leprariae]|uniref:Uncharacterized protein n=1 Tax=Nakamurella leprariae TaxID=2803911 RepID=A0A938YJI1_9ACTN|nr:hypothetical protein [Nakamurella leprariae]MBM9469432.1 hypothetical protein [Nakamurella leprariae]